MDEGEKIAAELAERSSAISAKHVLVGFDGFVDRIMTPIDCRTGPGDNFTPLATIEEFGRRISEAAGQSTNIELYGRGEKLGGNGPIMANALLAMGMEVKYIGALGHPTIHPVFAEFAERTSADPICQPGITTALEFTDGKIMLGEMSSLDQISYESLINTVGEGAFFDAVSRADLIALVNWTMTPHLTATLTAILDRVLPNLGPRENGRTFFFDLADPAKRSDGDLTALLATLKRFLSHGSVILGLNLKEARRVGQVLGEDFSDEKANPLEAMAQRIRTRLGGGCVVIHDIDAAACATKNEACRIRGARTENPVISTGGGDHFNAGFVTAHLLGLGPRSCLTIAVAASGFYVRTAKSPSLFELDSFIRNGK